MTGGLVRYYGRGDLHFITCSCYHRLPLLASPASRDLFLRILEEARQKLAFPVLGYVVMPEHFHLLMGEPSLGSPATVLQVVKQRFSRHRDAKQIPAWQRRFYDFNVVSQAKLIEKLRYIHRNPVRRGLVAKPEDWDWSSFCHYAAQETGPVRIGYS